MQYVQSLLEERERGLHSAKTSASVTQNHPAYLFTVRGLLRFFMWSLGKVNEIFIFFLKSWDWEIISSSGSGTENTKHSGESGLISDRV